MVEIIYFIVLAYMMPFESTRFVMAPIPSPPPSFTYLGLAHTSVNMSFVD